MQKAPRADEGPLVPVLFGMYLTPVFNSENLPTPTFAGRIHNNGNEADLSSLDDPIMD